MIQSLLVANRVKTARTFIRTQILPGTGRWREATEGQFQGKALLGCPSDGCAATSPSELWEDFVVMLKILPELVLGRGTAREASGGGAFHV